MRPLSRVLKAPHRDQTPRVIGPPAFASLEQGEHTGSPLQSSLGDEEEEELIQPLNIPEVGGQGMADTSCPGTRAGDGERVRTDSSHAPVTRPPAELEAPAESDLKEDAERAEAVAERMLAEARLQVAEFLREAQQQAQAMEAEARERGFREGLEAAGEAGKVLLADLEALRAAVQAEREQFFEGLEPEVVRLSLAIAEKIIRQEVDLHPEIVVGVARAAILQLKEAQTARVSAHPAGVDALRRHLAESLPGGSPEVSIHASPLADPGGCVVDSDRGSVDARLETQMERVAAALQEGDTG